MMEKKWNEETFTIGALFYFFLYLLGKDIGFEKKFRFPVFDRFISFRMFRKRFDGF